MIKFVFSGYNHINIHILKFVNCCKFSNQKNPEKYNSPRNTSH